jgi:hypothetical protein
MRNAALSIVGTSLLTLTLFGCASADAGSTSSSDSAYTSDHPATPSSSVTPFSDADAPPSFGARVRVSFDGAAAQQNATTASVDSRHTDKAMSYALGIGSLAGGAYFVYFGPAGSKLAVGTYSCADGDAQLFEAKWNRDGSIAETKVASSCSFVIDELKEGPAPGYYVRAYGRFQAAKSEGGLPSDVVGAFVADIPLPIAPPP